ncbi:hypothetical protein GT352_29190 [Streptomyces sp. SID1046]|uniref:DUF5677 domain-containing protein n=1 Tax=Streptomyces sp. SID1046 TaxID=2690249 RepID=UPI00136E56E9|nr:DUF5677 domain-containing protein [Streptomyces sp. SID1046]MYV77976.1 hypothetical protein [Streptomyces sp. SID1046]
MTDDVINAAGPEHSWHEAVQPPREELLQLTETLHRCISSFLQARNSVQLGKWEAPAEARALSNLMIRNLEATLLLARTDEVMVGAAWTCGRSVFEHAVRIMWLLHPDDAYDRECRWLGVLADTERSHRLVAEAMENAPTGPAGANHREMADAMQAFRDGVTALLPAGYTPQKPPSFERMLRSIDSTQMYRFYREGSQFVHGSMWGTALYRRNLGVDAQFGEFTRTEDWIVPLSLCWLSLRNAGWVLLDRLQAPQCDWERLGNAVDSDFRRLADALTV